MGYLYTAVWLVLAGYMLYTAIKRNRTPILFILSGFLVFLAVWEFINTVSGVDMKSGVYGWIYRGVALVVLILCFIRYFKSRRR